MDPFTQRMLEKAEQRSRALGISNVDATAAMAAVVQKPQLQQQFQAPLQATNSAASLASGSNRMQVVEKTLPINASLISTSSVGSGATPKKVLRQFAAVDKENMDLGIEINITTDKNIEVQVQVEEQDVTDDDEEQRPPIPPRGAATGDVVNQPLAKIRDQSRNRLQRLGALYSNTDDLSSPIHRTEGQFHAGSADDGAALQGTPRKQRYGKLVALANTINQWEDDTAHHGPAAAAAEAAPPSSAVPPPKPDLPSRRLAPETPRKKPQAPPPPITPTATAQTATTAECAGENVDATAAANKTKQLKWDPKVINSLEAQGFQRRESSTVKYAYDYGSKGEHREAPKAAAADEEQKTTAPERKAPAVKPGLVSGRAAVFESKASAAAQPQQRPQKDPTELSLRERMQLFERNKGVALVPKAAFGMAPSIAKIQQQQQQAATAKKDEPPKPAAATIVKGSADSKVRDRVAALVAGAATISENKIKADITKQRQEEMQLLANRFHRPKEGGEQQPAMRNVAAAARPPPPPPPPPPSSTSISAQMIAASAKRRSPSDEIDDDESKRAKKAAMPRLYPMLTDFDSSDNEENCATTASVSGRSTADDGRNRRDAGRHNGAGDGLNQDNDSYMASEADDDSSAGICNGSLGREIMQVVQKNEHQQQEQHQHAKQFKEVRYADKNLYYNATAGANADSSINSSEASLGMDDYLDEALDEQGDEEDEDDDDDVDEDDCTLDSDEGEQPHSAARGGGKGTTTSNSFSFRKTPKKYTNYQTIAEEQQLCINDTPIMGRTAPEATAPVRSELSVNREDENMVTLVHTVSFYRRQQNANSANTTPVRKVCREQQVQRSAFDSANAAAAAAAMHYDRFVEQQSSTPRDQHYTSTTTDEEDEDAMNDNDDDTQSDTDLDDAQLVQERIKKMLEEVCKQQQVIAQTSQALNLCAATIEFSGSTESVEGERHLLVATHRRQACLDEVQRLRVEKSLRPLGAPKEKGRLTVKEITVPLRQDYIRKLAADAIAGHHLVCLLKYNEHVLATKTVPTLPGLLAVKFPDALQLNTVYADFRITLEIYGMTAQREVLPHEVKYHINLSKKTGIKTPKKKCGSDNRLFMPQVQSPAGPNVVRTPALVQYGYAIFSLREIQRTSWSLTQVLGVSPLDGAVHMKVNCELSVSVEYKGFLTMFEDISGFGAWHRRWCHLNGTMLSYWKYPDDEKRKAPMGSVDLYACSSHKVSLAPRDICARLNTMLLECQRPARDTDQESLVIVPNGRTTIVRHLLSADTKEEREEWCAHLNKALTLLRAWGPPQ